MPWHDMATHLLFLSLLKPNVPNLVYSLPLTPLHLLDTLVDQVVHWTRQNTRRQDVPRRARAR
jgi:hypothetical protein